MRLSDDSPGWTKSIFGIKVNGTRVILSTKGLGKPPGEPLTAPKAEELREHARSLLQVADFLDGAQQ